MICAARASYCVYRVTGGPNWRERASPRADDERRLLVGFCTDFPACTGRSKIHINRLGSTYGSEHSGVLDCS